MDNRAALVDDGPLDRWVAVPQRIDPNAAQQVEIAVALFIDEMNTFASDEEKGIALVGLKQQLRFYGFDLVEFRHFIHS